MSAPDNLPINQVRICQNPACGFRFPIGPTEKKITRCPKCGSSTILAFDPYHPFAVPEKNLHRSPFHLAAVLDNIRSAFNVGAIFRTSDGAGFEKIFLCGITPTPENLKVQKTALGAEKVIPWKHGWDILETAQGLKKDGYQLWSLEGGTTSNVIFSQLNRIQPDDKIALIVGNEVSGVDPEVVKISDECVYLPMEGIKESLNVAVAFGIAAYYIRYGASQHV